MLSFRGYLLVFFIGRYGTVQVCDIYNYRTKIRFSIFILFRDCYIPRLLKTVCPTTRPFITFKISQHLMTDLTTSYDTEHKKMFDFWLVVVGCQGIFIFPLGGAAIYSCLFVGCSVDESYLFLASCRRIWLSWDVVGSWLS